MIRHTVPGVAGYEVVMDTTFSSSYEVYVLKTYKGANVTVWREFRSTEDKAKALANAYWTSIKNGKRP